MYVLAYAGTPLEGCVRNIIGKYRRFTRTLTFTVCSGWNVLPQDLYVIHAFISFSFCSSVNSLKSPLLTTLYKSAPQSLVPALFSS